jgi:hypothetical protein
VLRGLSGGCDISLVVRGGVACLSLDHLKHGFRTWRVTLIGVIAYQALNSKRLSCNTLRNSLPRHGHAAHVRACPPGRTTSRVPGNPFDLRCQACRVGSACNTAVPAGSIGLHSTHRNSTMRIVVTGFLTGIVHPIPFQQGPYRVRKPRLVLRTSLVTIRKVALEDGPNTSSLTRMTLTLPQVLRSYSDSSS